MTNILARIKSLGYAAAVTSGINKLNVLMHAVIDRFRTKMHALHAIFVLMPR